MKVRTKIFIGQSNQRADEQFNNWIKELVFDGKEINIKEFRYQQARYGDHSICILYEEL